MLRLMNVKTHQLETFDNWDKVPPYTILSHTWEEGEVIFHDILVDKDKKKQGWKKILGACIETEKLGILYLWVDTCCIFKESSAELSESINSMFAWYRDARICFAYIGDFGEHDNEALFEKSRWWTRGWTLQELIAPTEVMFFTKDWSFIGLRTSLASSIAKITGISEEILSGGSLHKLHDFSVAEKFSWAAKRKTTRGEDRAYSLMGIFGVSMSMIYGEGEQAAFFRLQKEIFGVFADHSIFAWCLPRGKSEAEEKHDLFAPSISAFEDSSNIISDPYNWDILGKPKQANAKSVANKSLVKYSTFSHGLCVQLLVENQSEGYFLAYLACRSREKTNTCLTLNLIFEKKTGNYHRTSLNKLREVMINYSISYKVTLEDVYMAQPRLDFALSLQPVRYQIESSSSLSNPDVMLYIMDDSVNQAGFALTTFFPPATHLEQTRSKVSSLAPLGLCFWDQGGVIIYKNQKTGESFAILIRTAGRLFLMRPMLLVCILDDIDPETFGAEAVDEFFQHYRDSFTDLSTQMVVKILRSGKQIILSLNTFPERSLQNLKLWVALKEPKI